MNGVRILSKKDIATLPLDTGAVMQAVESAYRGLAHGTATNPEKICVKTAEDHSIAYAMLAHDGDSKKMAFKTSYKYRFTADKVEQKYYTSLMIYDDETGLPLALMDCSRIGSLRTPAVSGLLARYAAPEGAEHLLMIGTGTQGQTALPFMVSALPSLRRISVAGTHEGSLADIVATARVHFPQLQIDIAADPYAAAADADVVLAVAGAATPFQIRRQHLKPGSLCILVGHGLHPDTLSAADVVVATSARQMQVTGQDMQDVNGYLRPADVELPDLVAGRVKARTVIGQTIFAYNSGMVITDVALGALIVDAAAARGVGQCVTLW